MRLLILCAIFLLAGCSRTPVGDLKIDASSPIRYSMWRASVGDQLSKDQWKLFDRSMLELKFKIMADGDASGSEAIDEAFRTGIDGRTLYQAVQSGLQLRINRLLSEKAELERYVTMNARLRTHEGDEESAQILKGIKDSQAVRVEQLAEQVDEAKNDMVLLEETFRREG